MSEMQTIYPVRDFSLLTRSSLCYPTSNGASTGGDVYFFFSEHGV
jgi:hypothetical protein